jgi:hypothetical protein
MLGFERDVATNCAPGSQTADLAGLGTPSRHLCLSVGPVRGKIKNQGYRLGDGRDGGHASFDPRPWGVSVRLGRQTDRRGKMTFILFFSQLSNEKCEKLLRRTGSGRVSQNTEAKRESSRPYGECLCLKVHTVVS